MSANDKVEAGVYNMSEIEHPILMSPTGTVAFQGYGLAPVITQQSMSNSMSAENSTRKIQELNDKEPKTLKDDSVNCLVYRDDIYNSIIKFYKEKNVHNFRGIVLIYL